MLSRLPERWKCDCKTHTNFVCCLQLLDELGEKWFDGFDLLLDAPKSGRYLCKDANGIDYMPNDQYSHDYFRDEDKELEVIAVEDLIEILSGGTGLSFDSDDFIFMLGGA